MDSSTRERLDLTVIIPVRNAASTLSLAVQSAMFQSRYAVDDVLVIDDGSTDSSADLASALGARVLRVTSRGVSAARNLGMQGCSTEFVAFLDADDWWHPRYLASWVIAASSRPDFCAGVRVNVRGEWLSSHTRLPPSDLSAEQLLIKNQLTTSAVVARRSAVLEAGGFDERLSVAEDADLWTRMVSRGAKYLPFDGVCYYRVGAKVDDEATLQRVVRDRLAVISKHEALLGESREEALRSLRGQLRVRARLAGLELSAASSRGGGSSAELAVGHSRRGIVASAYRFARLIARWIRRD